MKLNGERFRTDTRKYFSTQCMVTLQNLLLQDAMMATNLENFKRRVDKFLEVGTISGY